MSGGLVLGFVVVAYNQASGRGTLPSTELHRTPAEAQQELGRLGEAARASGRRDMYSLAQVALLVDET